MYYYQVHYCEYEDARVTSLDEVLLSSQTRANEEELKAMIRDIINKPKAELTITVCRVLNRSTYMYLGGKLRDRIK